MLAACTPDLWQEVGSDLDIDVITGSHRHRMRCGETLSRPASENRKPNDDKFGLEFDSRGMRTGFSNMGKMSNHPSMNNAAPSEQGPSVFTSERSLMVLSVIARHGQPLTVRKLIDITGLPQSTLYRHLLALKKWGLVQEQDNFYMPGPLSVQLAWGFDHTSYLVSNARPEMAQLVADSGESIGLMVAVNDQVTCLEMIESEQSLRCSFSKGRSHPLVRGASAKAVLAHLPTATADSIIDKQLCGNAKEIRRLQAELEVIRTQGYAVSEGEVDWGYGGSALRFFTGLANRPARLP